MIMLYGPLNSLLIGFIFPQFLQQPREIRAQEFVFVLCKLFDVVIQHVNCNVTLACLPSLLLPLYWAPLEAARALL